MRRAVNGILLLDKPCGITSNRALQKVKHLYQANKAGHTGSLDPLATGMLPICFGEATKFSQYLLNADKTYQVTAQLGVTTTTGDAEGEIVDRTPVPTLTQAQLTTVLQQFTGEVTQIPSMYSALKHQGRPLYELARQGITVERAPRQITIYALQLISQQAETLSLEVTCSKGTYIRTLVEDIGKQLGCGAHVAKLRRTAIAGLANYPMFELETLVSEASQENFASLDKHLLSIDLALPSAWPALELSAASLFYFRQGQAISIPRAPSSGWIKLYDKQRYFLGIGEVGEDGRVVPRRLLKNALPANSSLVIPE
jgi:tRNA pseudouridine55 synthase